MTPGDDPLFLACFRPPFPALTLFAVKEGAVHWIFLSRSVYVPRIEESGRKNLPNIRSYGNFPFFRVRGPQKLTTFFFHRNPITSTIRRGRHLYTKSNKADLLVKTHGHYCVAYIVAKSRSENDCRCNNNTNICV